MPAPDERSPSADQVRELKYALWRFLIDEGSYNPCPHQQEADRLPNFLRLADALHVIRPLVRRLNGWPPRLGTALPLIIEGFDKVADHWGWSRLALPEPARSEFVREQDHAFREKYERPIREAAISWQERDPRGCPPWVHELADQGRDEGLGATVTTSEEAVRLLTQALRDKAQAFRLANRFPVLKPLDGMPEDHIPDAKAYQSLDRGYALLSSVWNAFEAEERDKARARQEPTDPDVQSHAPSGPPAADAASALPIILGNQEEEVIVRGQAKPRLTQGQYRVVKALLDAHPARLSKETLAIRSGTEDPIGMIDRLREKDEDWASVLDKPGRAHGGYGIRVSDPRKRTRRKT